jgi:hypothetical protein
MSYWIPNLLAQSRDTKSSWVPVEGLLTIEKKLSSALHFVPYCEQHRKVWSPEFATIVLEAATHTDSLWRTVFAEEGREPKRKYADISDYREAFADHLAKQRVGFFGALPEVVALSPFDAWARGESTPGWWEDYNLLKHNRLENRHVGTLENAVLATAALLLAIIYCGKCDTAIASAGLLESYVNPLTEPVFRDIPADSFAIIETHLFGHVIGIGSDKIRAFVGWSPAECSPRFRMFWHGYSIVNKQT